MKTDKSLFRFSILLMAIWFTVCAHSQSITGIDEDGNAMQLDSNGNRTNRNFNPHNNDTTKKNKVVPKGIHVWKVDRKLGDIIKDEVDTLPHLYPQTTLVMGRNMEYNATGSNYTPRLSRIFINRPEKQQFIFTQPYDQVMTPPENWHFTNTLSPITNLSYDNCGDKQNGEDHLEAKFAVNAGRRIGIGFDLNYAYARGYFQNQSTSHFGGAVYGSYLGDKYQLHALFSAYHQKVTENGGITNDDYISHPDLFTDSYSDDEIPTVLNDNWNRNDSKHLFLTHRYNIGFYRKVKMTDEEIKAREFSQDLKQKGQRKTDRKEIKKSETEPQGRPQGAKIAGTVPIDSLRNDSIQKDSLTADTTRIRVTSRAEADSLLAEETKADSLAALIKKEFVPVTSFIHTLDLSDYEHIYQAYRTPKDYYGYTRYNIGENGAPGDTIYDQTKHLMVKNTLGLALLEGFNKWMMAGIKLFGTHEYRSFDMPQISTDGITYMERWTEQNLSLGGRLSKTKGKTLHYDLTAETWLIGEDAGQLKVDFKTDLNFPLFNDTVQLAAKAYFHRLNPTFYERQFHSKHLWWDNDLSMITRTRVEGLFSYEKLHTRLRVAIEELQNYTYWAMSYTNTDHVRSALTGSLEQYGSNLNVLTAQLEQPLALGPLHWDNVVTFQSTSNEDVLPLPALNVFSNLYLQFTYAKVLRVELGAAATWFSKYYAPDYLPQLGQFAVQQNTGNKVEIGNFPFIDVYANLHLKHARFFVMMNNITGTSFNKMAFLVPHYPVNRSVLHIGVSWNFFN